MNYRDLVVFQKSHELVIEIYKVVKLFPKEESYRLVNQLVRSAYSIPANIAEGASRNTTKDYINFLYIARGSLNELQYFLLLSKDLEYLTLSLYDRLDALSCEIALKLNALIKSLKTKLK